MINKSPGTFEHQHHKIRPSIILLRPGIKPTLIKGTRRDLSQIVAPWGNGGGFICERESQGLSVFGNCGGVSALSVLGVSVLPLPDKNNISRHILKRIILVGLLLVLYF